MKNLSLIFLIASLLSSCAPRALTPTIELSLTATQSPTNTPPSRIATATPTHTPEPTFTPWPIPSNVTFCLDKVESDSEKDTIQESIRKAHQYFVEQLGVEPRPVIIFAGPDLNKLAGQGECVDNPQLQRTRRDLHNSWKQTGGYATLGVQTTNTDYSVWKQDIAFRKFTVAHEYVHELQMTLLDREINGEDAGPRWLIEGSAQVIAYSSQGVDPMSKNVYWVQNKDNIPSSSHLGTEGNAFWDIAPYAVSYLISVAPDNMLSIVNYFAYKPTTRTWKSAFEKAFGLTPEKFSDEFETFRKTQNAPSSTPKGAVKVQGNVVLKDSSQNYSDYIIHFCVSKCLPGISIRADGSFNVSLQPGTYKIIINSTVDGKIIGWYSKHGLVENPLCSGGIVVQPDEKEDLTISIDTPQPCP